MHLPGHLHGPGPHLHHGRHGAQPDVPAVPRSVTLQVRYRRLQAGIELSSAAEAAAGADHLIL